MEMTTEEKTKDLQRCIDEIALVPNSGSSSPEFARWRRDTELAIGHAFGDQEHSLELKRIQFSPALVRGFGRQAAGRYAAASQRAFADGLSHARVLLQSMIDELLRYG